MTITLFVGIEVNKKSYDIRFTDSNGETLSLFNAPNNHDGAVKILKKLKDTILHTDFSSVTIGMESTSIYADHLAVFLRNDDFLKKWNVKVHILNAKQVRKFKAAYPELPKNDNIDTLIIADYLRFGILAEIGDIYHFDNHAALAKYAGITWSRYQSGAFEAFNTKLILSDKKYLKYYFLKAANKVRVHDTEFQRFYQTKFKEVLKHQHKRALALTARKLVRLVYALFDTNRLYIPPTK